MTTIVIKPKSKAERNFLTRLLKKKNVDASVVEEPLPNYETLQAMKDVEQKKGTEATDINDLFEKLGI